MIERFKDLTLDDQEKSVLRHVETHGWNVTSIRDEDGRPGWSFTIGLFENFGHPEVIIFGMSHESRHSILNWIGDNVRKGIPFISGEEHDWVLDGHNCWSLDVDKQWYKDLVGWAIWFYRGKDFPLIQCIWPSKEGAYPWQSSSPFFASQPLLYECDPLFAGMLHYLNDKTLTESEWPFAEDPHLGVFVCRCVMEDGAPIVLVSHDREGDWQFIGPVDEVKTAAN